MPLPPLTIAIGCISGTSMDGIDVSLVRTDGDGRAEPGPGATYPYDPALRRDLLALIAEAWRAETEPFTDLEARVTAAHAGAVQRFMAENGLTRADVALIGLHGQTIWHRPEKRFTRQLLDGAEAARQLGIDVIARFRHADVTSGGQGAPFAPLYHRALAAPMAKPLMVLNLGGVGNVTYIDDDTVIAFDTGPASALIDDWVLRHKGFAYDDGGRIAASGRVDESILARLMDNPYFALAPPKSLDRQDFHARAKIIEGLSVADGAATLAAFTIRSVAISLAHVPQAPARWLVTGGGRLNRTFMDGLRAALGVPVDPVEAAGWNGDFIEAQCFGYLAVRSSLGLPLSLPTTTGVPHPMPGGERFPA